MSSCFHTSCWVPHTCLTDLLVDYTLMLLLLFNMDWKRSQTLLLHFFLPELNSNKVCVHVSGVWQERKGKNYSLALFHSFSLTPDPCAQQLWGKRRIANELAEMKLIGLPHRLLVKLWADVSSTPLLLQSTAQSRENKEPCNPPPPHPPWQLMGHFNQGKTFRVSLLHNNLANPAAAMVHSAQFYSQSVLWGSVLPLGFSCSKDSDDIQMAPAVAHSKEYQGLKTWFKSSLSLLISEGVRAFLIIAALLKNY